VALADFVMTYLNESEKESFVRRVCDADGITISRPLNDSLACREVSGKLTPEKAQRYLEALRRRQAQGVPLVR
jgi:hypothetical protein